MKLKIAQMGRIDYGEALSLQEKLHALRQGGRIPDTLLLQEHNSVITVGRRGSYSNILLPGEELLKKKIDVYEVSRGGDVTYHGPGQLVGYPIFDLKDHEMDIRKYVWNIQEVFIRILKEDYGMESRRENGVYTGVWVGNSKITAIGIAVRRWVTMHGFAFNINTDLDNFRWINPCGLTDRGVTSLEKITGKRQDFVKVSGRVINLFENVFGMEGEIMTGQEILDLTGAL
jgi:lipoyl(octanoyl) transferase